MKMIMSFVAVLTMAAPTFASHRHHHHNGDGLAVISAALSTGFWLAELSHHHHYKMAIVQGEEAALAVLEGSPASDLFLNAKDVAQTILDVEFGDEEQAALTILEMNQTLDEKSMK